MRLLGEQNAAWAVDWNQDGRTDLLVGQTAEALQLFLQTNDAPIAAGARQ
jgi:hypothetical protein